MITSFYEKFIALSDEAKYEMMEEAIEHMKQYNGRSVNECIGVALGGEVREDENGKKIVFTNAEAKNES